MNLASKPIKKTVFIHITKPNPGIHPPAYRPPSQRKTSKIVNKIHKEIFESISLEDSIPDFLME